MNKKEIEGKRRRIWFSTCRELGISEDIQSGLADQFIPDSNPGKYKPDNSISRKPLFTNQDIWNDVINYFSNLKKNQISLDSAKPGQIKKAFVFARQLGWAENGDDDLRNRLLKFATRQTRSSKSPTIHNFDILTKTEMNNVIEGLKSMKNRINSSQ